MNLTQSQIRGFLAYAKETVKGYNKKKCEGSDHVHIGDELIGGFSGTRQEYFIVDCQESENILLDMFPENEMDFEGGES